jgi:hypothetical protein
LVRVGEVAVFRIAAAAAVCVGEGEAGGGRRVVAGGRPWIGDGIWKGFGDGRRWKKKKEMVGPTFGGGMEGLQK